MKRKRDEVNQQSAKKAKHGLPEWATKLPGYNLPFSLGLTLTGGGVAIIVVNSLLDLRSVLLSRLGASITIPGLYLVTAKGLHLYSLTGGGMEGWQNILNAGRATIIPGLVEADPPKPNGCPNIIDTYIQTPVGKIPFPSLFAPFNAVRKAYCMAKKLVS